MSDTVTTETVQRRPEYIERLEKALLEGIFGIEDENAILKGGLLQNQNLFGVAPYRLAGQQGRAQPISGQAAIDLRNKILQMSADVLAGEREPDLQ